MTVSNLLLDIKRKAQLGQNQQTITNADILDLANRELRSYMAPRMVAVQERYFSAVAEYNITSRRRYRIPARCVGGRILDVVVVDQVGRETRIPRLHATDNLNDRFGFIVDGRDVVLCSEIRSNILRIEYQLRPSGMVETATSYPVTAVSSGNITSTAPAGVFDVMAISGLSQVAIQSAVSSGSSVMSGSSEWVVQRDLTDFVSVGDRVIATNTTDIVPLPDELHDLLAFRSAMRLKQMQGLNEEASNLEQMAGVIESAAFDLITPRSENAEKSIVTKDLLGNWY